MSSRLDKALRALGKLGVVLIGAGLLTLAGASFGSWFANGPPLDTVALEERIEDVEMEAAAALGAASACERRALFLEVRMEHLESRIEPLERAAEVEGAAAAAAPPEPARPLQRRTPRKPAAVPPASSHWRF